VVFQAKETAFDTNLVRASTCENLSRWLLPSPSMHRRIWPIATGLVYIAVIALLGGLRSDHILIGCLGFLDAYNEKSRSFLKYFFPFILTGIAYDSMRYFYWDGVKDHVHVSGPYLRDKHYFGINAVSASGAPERLTVNEYFDRHNGPILDFFCGFAYLFFVCEYLLTAFALFFTEKRKMLRIFGWCFFIVNVVGFITYFIYPAAPPWYVSAYGLGPAQLHIAPAAAAAHRFDLLFGTHFFDAMYGRGIDVYGAYPSLHVAYPFLVGWVALKLKKGRIFAVGFYFLMCFSAVYLQHHYVVDILLGTAFAFVVLFVMTRVISIPEGELT
jgi:inositol phosphorylceramide synthase catalytic subunit